VSVLAATWNASDQGSGSVAPAQHLPPSCAYTPQHSIAYGLCGNLNQNEDSKMMHVHALLLSDFKAQGIQPIFDGGCQTVDVLRYASIGFLNLTWQRTEEVGLS
jgi:hypothetical protein